MWRHKIFFDTNIKYHVIRETSTKKIYEILKSKYLIKSIENHLHLMRRLYSFQLKRGISISEHMNNYMKLLADLAYVDMVIEEEDKALILLSSLPDEDYETFVLTLINGKKSLGYNEVSFALVNHEVRKKGKELSKSTSAEALMIRGKSFSQKGKGNRERSKFKADFKDLKKNQCTFYKELGHWKVNCPRIKDKKESKPE